MAAVWLSALVPAPTPAAPMSFGLSSVGLNYPFAAAIAQGFQQQARKAGVNAIVVWNAAIASSVSATMAIAS